MNKKRVLIFSFAYFPHVGGAEVAVREITDRLGRRESNCEFDMITYRFSKHDSPEERIGNVNVYRVNCYSKYLFPFASFAKAMVLNGRKRYNIAWSIMANYAGFGALFFKLFNLKTKFLLTLQEGDPIPHIKRRVRFVWPLFKRIFKYADTVQCISHYLAHFASEMHARGPIVVVPNGVDIGRFAEEYSELELYSIKNKLGKREGDIMLITTSRLVTKNAVADVISAMAQLPENVHLIVAGVGPLRESLHKQAEMLGVSDRVRFLGFISQEELPAYLQACDIFIRTPLSEGFGISFVEAFAARIPVITTPVGGILDFLKERETGLFADVESPESIAQAVMELVRNLDLVSKIKRQAFEMVKEKYDWNIVAGEMKKVFDNI